jgi:multiple sugar transport system permease protein
MKRALRITAFAVVLAVTLVPLIWMIESSFKPNPEISQDGTLFPHAPTFGNYQHLFSDRDFGAFLRNSIIVTVVSVAISMVIGTMAAYVIARYRLKFGLDRRIGMTLLVGRVIPGIVIVVPIYLLILRLNLLNTLVGLIGIYAAINLTFVVWMMDSFFREIPIDLEEAAMVDGDTRFSAFRRIALPLAAPGLAATSIFAVIVTFNEFLFVLTLTASPKAQTVPAGTATLVGRVNIDWGAMSAAGVIGALPIIFFALLVQKHLVRGLTLGAVK